MYRPINPSGVSVPGAFDAAKLDAWLEEAQPGARIVYFHGFYAGHGNSGLNERLLAEEGRGMLYLVQDHRAMTDYGYDYVAIRSSRPFKGPVPKTLSEQARAEGERAFRSSGR